MKLSKKIVSVVLLIGMLSIGIAGCSMSMQTTTTTTSKTTIDDIMQQDAKEVYQKVNDKMLSIGSFSLEGKNFVEGDITMDASTKAKYIDLGKDNWQAMIEYSSGPLKHITYFKDGNKYEYDIDENGQEKKVKSKISKAEMEMYSTALGSVEKINDIRLEKNGDDKIDIILNLSGAALSALFGNMETSDYMQKITIDNEYKIISMENEIPAEGEGINITLKENDTYSYGDVVIDFPSFDDYVEI